MAGLFTVVRGVTFVAPGRLKNDGAARPVFVFWPEKTTGGGGTPGRAGAGMGACARDHVAAVAMASKAMMVFTRPLIS
jgi:hypothetical protein